MLLRMEKWNRIRETFTEDEKSKLNSAITGETICPRGCVLDESILAEELVQKLRGAQ